MQFAPAPDSDALSAAVGWVEQLLLGSAASAVAILGVATVGALMLTGRADWRLGARVISGCFLVFSATTIAGGLTDRAPPPRDVVNPTSIAAIALPVARPPVNNFDPYAGAAPVLRPIGKDEFRSKLQTETQPSTFSLSPAALSSPTFRP
ncbi:MAG: TrbC/VirB2 family protein [Sphingomonas sp.]|jgi:type IV secretion system protein VirB2